jgi:hypothetical protein
MTLHRRANRRSMLPGYAKVRGELYALMKGLLEGDEISATGIAAQQRKRENVIAAQHPLVQYVKSLAKLALSGDEIGSDVMRPV